MAGPVTLPLVVSPDKRYLMGSNGAPFMVAGDSPQCLSANLSTANMDAYFAARAAQGFNASWVNLLCTTYTGGRTDATTYDGIAPFTGTISGGLYDLTKPNPTYFARVDALFAAAAAHGTVVFADPIEFGGFSQTIQANSAAAASSYGQFLGARYRNQANIVWMSGNDMAGFNMVDKFVDVATRHSDRRRHAVANSRARLAGLVEHARRPQLGSGATRPRASIWPTRTIPLTLCCFSITIARAIFQTSSSRAITRVKISKLDRTRPMHTTSAPKPSGRI